MLNLVTMFIGSHRCVALCVAGWLSGSALVSLNDVTLRRARLVLGWVTVQLVCKTV